MIDFEGRPNATARRAISSVAVPNPLHHIGHLIAGPVYQRGTAAPFLVLREPVGQTDRRPILTAESRPWKYSSLLS